MKTGVELIAEELQEQITKHGFDLSDDQDYGKNELSSAAAFCLNPKNEKLWPWRDGGIGTHFMEKIKNKTYQQRLIICGAFCAAELDRLTQLK